MVITHHCQQGRMGEKDREFGIDMYTPLYLKWTLSAPSHPRKGRSCDLGGSGVEPPTPTSPFSCGICGPVSIILAGSSPGHAQGSVGVHCVLHPRALQGLHLPTPGTASLCTRRQAGGSVHSSPPLPILSCPLRHLAPPCQCILFF